MERRLWTRPDRIHGRTRIKQCTDDLDVASTSGPHDDGLYVFIPRTGVGPGIQEDGYCLLTPMDGCPMKSGLSPIVCG
jgi:hypothetical protein